MTRANLAFASWLADNYPELFAALAARASNPAASGLSGWGDVFSSIGNGIANAAGAVVKYGGQAVTAVANFVGSEQGQNALASLAGMYVQSQANKTALEIQLANLANQRPPAPISTVVDPVTGTTTPVYQPTAPAVGIGLQQPTQPAQALTPSLAQQLLNSARSPDYTMPIAIGAGALVLVLLMRNR